MNALPYPKRLWLLVTGFAALSLVSGALLPGAESDRILRISGTGSGMSVMSKLAEAFNANHPDVEVGLVFPVMGSGGGIRGVLAGLLDIAVSARPLQDSEKAQGLTAIEYARTPFVLAMARGNEQISSLTLQELARIYRGEMTVWPDGSRIRLVLRPSTDTDTGALKSISPEMAHATEVALSREGMTYPPTDQDAADLIARVPGAIGSTTLALIMAENRRLTPLAIDGVRPNVQSLRDGSYPYYKTLYLVVPSEPSTEAEQFLALVRSAQGHGLLSSNGCSVTITQR